MSCSNVCQWKNAGIHKKSNDLSNMTDDFWGSDEEQISSYADLQRAHISQGYLDGIIRAQESGLQNGFDKGFPEGAVLGKRVGEILGKLHGSFEFENAQKALNITKVLNKSYFDEQLDLKEHPLLTRWENLADDQWNLIKD